MVGTKDIAILFAVMSSALKVLSFCVFEHLMYESKLELRYKNGP